MKVTPACIAAGLDGAMPTKWRKGQRVNPEDVRALAIYLNRPVLEAFLAAGFLTPSDADQIVEVDKPLTAHADDALLLEVRRRMADGRQSTDYSKIGTMGAELQSQFITATKPKPNGRNNRRKNAN